MSTSQEVYEKKQKEFREMTKLLDKKPTDLKEPKKRD